MAEFVPPKKRGRKGASAETMSSPGAIAAAWAAEPLPVDFANVTSPLQSSGEAPAEEAVDVMSEPSPVLDAAVEAPAAFEADVEAPAAFEVDAQAFVPEVEAEAPALEIAPVTELPPEPDFIPDHAPALGEAAPVSDHAPADAAPLVVAADIIDATRQAAEPIKKGYQLMATPFDATATTEKAKAMFGDINERAKGAMEKSVKMGEEMSEFTKGNVEALVASGRIAAKGAESMAQDVAETMKKHFESATAQMKSIASVKSPTELFQLQSEFAKNQFDLAVADASKFSESMMKLFGDIAQPLSSRYAVAAEKIKTPQA